jgi:predicted nuclease of predicted toxin-antitoxin system
MKFKIDENLPTLIQSFFLQAEHDVRTVRSEGMQGCSDQALYDACCSEHLCLITLDLGFADVTLFPPAKCGGIAVLRVPKHSDLQMMEKMIRQFLEALSKMSIRKNLWIVEFGRIRIHQVEKGK